MKYNWSKTNLENTVAEANCWFNWLELLGIPKRGNNYRTLKRKAEEFKLDTSHFDSKYGRIHNDVRRLKNRTNEEIFCENSRINRVNLKKEYIRRVLNGNAKCECCGITDWNNKVLEFQIHHINGYPKDDKVDNLILLCPNCHSQTDNFSNKKRNCPIV